MCGICGEWYRDEPGQASLVTLDRMCKVLAHRGPDGQGLYLSGQGQRVVKLGEAAGPEAETRRGRIGLGHRRLSIIDLATGAQPLANEDGSIWIVFNGEIYNFRQLRAELAARGHSFSTASDTESIVHLYEEHGDGCVPLLNGMFAFALWDERQERLLLARDRFGIKPLFYAWDGRRLVFGSELKAILEVSPDRDIDPEALHDFLSFNYIPGPRTIYRGIQKLQPGHVLVADRHGIRVERYWHSPLAAARPEYAAMGPEQAADELLARMRRAVAAQMVSDVPLGVFLSGGLDSGTLVALMSEVSNQPVRTFSIGFEERSYSELPAARRIATRFRTDHTELIVTPDVRSLLPTLVRSFDEPFADSSAIPTYYVSQLARSSVTVALGGDGGDEVFAGYETYTADRLATLYRRLPQPFREWFIRPLVNLLPSSEAKVSFDYKAKRFVENAAKPAERAHVAWKAVFGEAEKRRLYREGYPRPQRDSFDAFGAYFDECPAGAPLDRAQYADMAVYLPDDILVKVDRMSMAHSLEVRVPFLDNDVVDFTASLPPRLRLHGLTKKYILKRAVGGLLPRQTVHGRKRGFNVPIGRWLRQDLRDLVGDYLSESSIRRQGVFEPRAVADLVHRHHARQADYARHLWGLLMFCMWKDQQSA